MAQKSRLCELRYSYGGPGASDRVGCEEGNSEREHPRGRTAADSVEANAAVHPTPSSGRGRRTPAVASDSCPDEGATGRREASNGGPSTQACLREDLAMSAERPDEVARISNIMCQAAQQWQQEVAAGILPSMVSKSAS